MKRLTAALFAFACALGSGLHAQTGDSAATIAAAQTAATSWLGLIDRAQLGRLSRP